MRDTIRTRKPALGADPPLTVRERLVLDTVRRQVETTRARLIQLTGLTGPAVFRTTEDLARRGLLVIGDPVAAGRGQPSHKVRLHAEARATLGVAVMTDHAEAVLMDFTGAVRARRELRSPDMKRSGVTAEIRDFLGEAVELAGMAPQTVIACGLAIAGYFTGEPGAVNPASELDDWALIDLEAVLGAALGLPVMVENIANAAAVAERMLGVGAWASSFAYLNFAHGFGAGLIVEGALLRGRCGNAGELAGVLQAAGLPSPSLSSLRTVLSEHGVEAASISDLVGRFRMDWPGVEAWVAAHGPSLSRLANTLRYTLDTEAIVLGGRLPRALGERLIQEVRWIDEMTPPRRGVGWPVPKLVCAEVGTSAAAIGAAALRLQRDYFA